MAVTDLTNTKWLFNNEPSLADDEWHINFTSNNQTFDTINPTDASEIMWYSYNNYSVMIDAYNENSTPRWQNEAYKTIEITGGTDVTNVNLISWLTANATQITSGGSMYLGTSTISKMYLGQNEVSKVYLGQDLVYEKQASTITFTIEDITYTADNGMTWGQWVASAYNTNNKFAISGNYVYNTHVAQDAYVQDLELNNVIKSDTIVNGGEYVVSGGN